MGKIVRYALAAAGCVFAMCGYAQQPGGGGPKLGSVPNGRGLITDKSGDTVLQTMIREIVPEFQQFTYTDLTSGNSMVYNLYTPATKKANEKYPLVLFMADASTPGANPITPLTQGYGALVWATEEWQSQHPCYVLVPQFSGVAVNDAYERTDEVDMVISLLSSVVSTHPIDTDRLYTTGQSMGGMISEYFNAAYPDVFAASIFVDSHWNPEIFPEMVRHKFVYFIAGDSGHAYTQLKPIEEACEKEDIGYTFAEWSAKLPEATQSDIAATMLAKGKPVNLFMFEPKTVLPASGKGSEHMCSFDYAYRVKSVREWLFQQKK